MMLSFTQRYAVPCGNKATIVPAVLHTPCCHQHACTKYGSFNVGRWVTRAQESPQGQEASTSQQSQSPKQTPDSGTARAGNSSERNVIIPEVLPPGSTAGNTKGGDMEADEDIDAYLGNVWEDIKKDMTKNLSPEEAKMLESVEYDDIMDGDRLVRKLVDEQLGPILAQVGVDEDPYAFFIDLVKVAAFMQLVTCGTLFYSAELLAHYDTGEAFRAAGGLTLGYLLRPFFKVEQLLWPIYNWGLRLFSPIATYEVAPSSREEVQATLNRLGIMIAVMFFLPQALLHWDVHECVQLVAPLAVGLFLFDIVFLIALLLKLPSL